MKHVFILDYATVQWGWFIGALAHLLHTQMATVLISALNVGQGQEHSYITYFIAIPMSNV
jgi:hypothetical protein